MNSDNSGNVVDIKQQLEDAKKSLITLNENLRRYVGRNTKEPRCAKQRQTTPAKRSDSEHEWKVNRITGSKYSGRSKTSVFNRLSTALNSAEEVKPRLNSRIIRELPTREEIVEAQCKDSESRERNRRMFGSLLGTLQKFSQEESRLKPKEEKKAIIEKKLEEQELQERESLKKARESLYFDKRKKQQEIKNLEIKMQRIMDFKNWEESMHHCRHYFRTKTKPFLYYKPIGTTNRLENLRENVQSEIESLIKLRREQIHKELIEIDNNLDYNSEETNYSVIQVVDNSDYVKTKKKDEIHIK